MMSFIYLLCIYLSPHHSVYLEDLHKMPRAYMLGMLTSYRSLCKWVKTTWFSPSISVAALLPRNLDFGRKSP
jgi:hypothetical protein